VPDSSGLHSCLEASIPLDSIEVGELGSAPRLKKKGARNESIQDVHVEMVADQSF
jgi:hypothetical protein